MVLAVVAHVRRWRAARELAGPRGLAPWLATLLRTAAYLCVVAAISGVTMVETEREDRLTVVALQDASQSISRSETSWMRSWLDELVGTMRRDDEFALLTFGRDSGLVSGPGAPALPDQITAETDASATNVMGAIDSGASLASAHGGALVLLTDGNQNAGDASVAAESARRRGVRVYPIVPPRHQVPLTIEHVTAPEVVRQGGDVKLAVAIANRGTETLEATLVARQGDKELGRVPLRVEPGRSVVDAEVRAGNPGHYAVTVALEAAPEIASARARHSTTLSVLAPPRVLVVSSDAALVPLLRDAGFDVERRAQLGPVTPAELARFHAVVVGTVSRADLAPDASRRSRSTWRDEGGGLLVGRTRPGLRSEAARQRARASAAGARARAEAEGARARADGAVPRHRPLVEHELRRAPRSAQPEPHPVRTRGRAGADRAARGPRRARRGRLRHRDLAAGTAAAAEGEPRARDRSDQPPGAERRHRLQGGARDRGAPADRERLRDAAHHPAERRREHPSAAEHDAC